MARPTIANVAEIAGVSKATVSRVLSGNAEYMRPETRARVLEAIESLDYRPSSVARSLTSKRTFTAGLLVSDIGNPFYPEVINGVEETALEQGYNIFLCNTSYDLERGMTYVRSLIDKQVDGVLIMSSTMSDEWVQELAKHNIPTIILDWEINDNVNGALGVIEVNFETGIKAAVEHLVALGHTRLAHVGGPPELRTSRLRLDAFRKATAALSISPEQVTIIPGNLRMDGGRVALDQIVAMPERPTAVFAANDLMAMGLIRAARANGLQVPADLSVIGLDDIWLIADMEPPLTTVALPRFEIGRLAMEMLFELLAADEAEKSTTPTLLRRQVETHLVIRQSTAAPA
jgi:LacI family transcriptional regulator